jgi:UDP-N-acetylglucosamine 2-epimerase (non-hydrolysing)
VMIDSLVENLGRLNGVDILSRLGVEGRDFVLVTLHRPSNVDQESSLRMILDAFDTIQRDMPIIFPIHPRTLKMLDVLGLKDQATALKNLKLLDPLGYLDFLALMKNARVVLTDSGGIQEETTYLGIQCLTLRPNTERPVTITVGTNRLVELSKQGIMEGYREALENPKVGQVPELWDGGTASRIVEYL